MPAETLEAIRQIVREELRALGLRPPPPTGPGARGGGMPRRMRGWPCPPP